MAFLSKGKKIDLYNLALELRVPCTSDDKIIDLRDKITNCTLFKADEQFIKETLNNIVEERKTLEDEEKRKLEREDRRLAEERAFELEKLKLQTQNPVTTANPSQINCSPMRLDLKTVLPTFIPDKDDMSLFLTMFERQMKLLNVSTDLWVSYLIGVLPTEIGKLIAREPEEKFKDYAYIRTILLQRFKLTADRFRVLFSRHHKRDNSTWKDFFFELRTYFEGWLDELEINSFDALKKLIIADQIKKRVSPDIKEHFLDTWPDLNSPLDLVEKLDSYDCVRSDRKKTVAHPNQRKPCNAGSEDPKMISDKKTFRPEKTYRSKPLNNPERPALTCYGCGRSGYIKAKCPTCNPSTHLASTRFENIKIHSFDTSTPNAIVYVTINEIFGTACADSGASHSVAGERLYNILKEEGAKFEKSFLTMTLADGSQREREVHTTCVNVSLEGRSFPLTLIALPDAKRNRTLLGANFLENAGVVLNLRDRTWFFNDNPKKCFQFVENSVVQSCDVKETANPASPYLLRPDEGEHLTDDQCRKLNTLISHYETCFRPGGEPTPYIEHRIDTGDAPPVASTPYRLSPARKEILKREIDALLASGIIEECDSPYASPVVLIPKPNGEFRLCIDYRKLNAVTKSDPYPLPRMDDLLQNAKQTAFMSTIDLKSGYHQIKMYPPDKDKTAFVCPFGVYRFTRMPFGLKTAPATFQRLMDFFRNGLKVNTLAYLDDIIVMSSTFEEHLEDLRLVFGRLQKFKLHANRAKCHFACPKVKYLGHYITSSGLEVDPAKVKAIEQIPPPKGVKQVQSFLQTCSWYRRYIPHFAEISRPLSNLTKKSSSWKWGQEEQAAFELLKKSLISPPVLKQVDETKPFVLRTDASNYALGAVLIQGQGPEEHPIEYASRLLTSAERNYSTTEREALAVVWALEKFRGYIEGTPITVASDHQPLKWLLSLKSPTGRLARWALQIQSYDLKVEYIPGKANVVADMLSRPACMHEKTTCEICTVIVDLPSRKASDIREGQLQDEDLKKIIDCFESNSKDENYLNWTNRGYLMSQGILYRYAPESESEEAQLVVPTQERERILQEYHDAPTAGHYGAEGTFHKIASRYFFPGMRKYITDYVKHCAECNRYKPSNQKPAGLLRTPVYSQRFEILSIDLFGPLPETPDGKKWIFIVEDTSTKWVELFSLQNATAKECAVTLLEEVFLRYGLPRRLISDNGSQFVSAVMQQLCFLLGIIQDPTPVYCPQANPVERKNRDLKPKLAILVGDNHTSWSEKLPSIRFALNTARCDTTGQTAAFLQFGREPRTLDDIQHDIRSVIDNDNFVAEITPYLRKFAKVSKVIKDRVEQKQDQRKKYADQKRRSAPQYAPGDKVWVTSHPVSNKGKKRTAKFAARRDGPFIIVTQRSPTSYEIANPTSPDIPVATYHVSALRPYLDTPLIEQEPITPLRNRGRPRKTDPIVKQSLDGTIDPANGYSPRRLRSHGGRTVMNNQRQL